MSESTTTFRSLKEFAEKGGIALEKMGRLVLSMAVEEIGKRWMPYAIAITSIGGILSRRRKDRAPGLMKSQWMHYRNRTGFEVLKNFAPHGIIIDRGRKKGVTAKGAKRDPSHRKGKVNKLAKMMGSKQAPQGVTRAVWKRINKVERADISARAIARAEQWFGKAA